MIDEERQAVFKGELYNYIFTFKMRQSALVIDVQGQQTLHKFHKTVDQCYIDSQDKYFQVNFETPGDVFDHLAEHFAGILFQNGILRFSYKSGKKQQVREVTIQLEQEEIDKLAFANFKIAKLKEHFAALMQERDDRIYTLEQGLLELGNQFQEYKKENQLKKHERQEKIQQLEHQLQREEMRRRQLQERLEKTEAKVNHLTALVEQLKEKELRGSELLVGLAKPIGHHMNNPHKEKYILINQTLSSAKIIRTGADNKYYNFVNKSEVIPKQKTKYSVKIIKAANSLLMIGFCTEKGLGNINNHNSVESAYYCCYGYLREGGVCRQLSDCESFDGDVVECVADLLERKMRWFNGEKMLAQCDIPSAMKGKPVYLSIMLMESEDEVEVSSI